MSGRWLGHAADHVLVAAPASGSVASLENAIGRVAIDAFDPVARDRVVGRILGISPPPGEQTVGL